MSNIIKERIVDEDIGDILQSSYINYAMSVLTDRALPDIRDGFKPVHRRILYVMYLLHLTHTSPTKKCARIVGDVLGKYHPHGDSSVYDALVRMAQDFSLRHPLIIGQGNFGSIDGDPPAAYRYTEATMSIFGEEVLKGVEKNIVPFIDNFDATLKEPTVLPSRFPNLIVNGSNGIAVGMTTNMPPHNLGETINAIIATMDNENISDKEIMKYIKGPDFPTGGIIVGNTGIKEAYATGKGRIYVRGEITRETTKNKEILVISSVPYGVNKSLLISKIEDAIKEEKIVGITEIRDESTQTGIRIVIETRKNIDLDNLCLLLYKYSDLQVTYSISNVVLVDGKPKQVSLKEMLLEYIKFQRLLIKNDLQHQLEELEKKQEFLEGLYKIKDALDEVIAIIRSTKKVSIAKEKLINKFSLTEYQAKSILDLKLYKLIQEELNLLLKELPVVKKRIKELNSIISSNKKLDEIIKEELVSFASQFGDKRRTKVLIKEDNSQPVLQKDNTEIASNISFCIDDDFNISDTGVIYNCLTTDTLLVFTKSGTIFKIPVSQTQSINKKVKFNIPMYLNIPKTEIVSCITTNDYSDFIYFITKKGFVKKMSLDLLKTSRTNSSCIKLVDDQVVNVLYKVKNILIITKKNMAIRFDISAINSLGKTAQGVVGIKLAKDDFVISADVEPKNLVVIFENNQIKKLKIDLFPEQKRGGKGSFVITTKVKPDIDKVFFVNEENEIKYNEYILDITKLKNTNKSLKGEDFKKYLKSNEV